MLGRISFWANSSAVCAMSWCCSEKSSGVKTSSRARDSRRKLPPGKRVGTDVALDMKPFYHEGHEGTRRKTKIREKPRKVEIPTSSQRGATSTRYRSRTG